jgi:hypothetical protein
METLSGRLTNLVTGGSGVVSTGSFGLALQMGSDQPLFPSSESGADMEKFGLRFNSVSAVPGCATV